MKRLSIRLRLMTLMICLTTLPVITVTWLAANNTRDSVEKEIESANLSRMQWAEQYVGEMIGQIETLFTALQINKTLMESLNNADSGNADAQFKAQNDLRTTMTSFLYANARRVSRMILYSEPKQLAYSVDMAGSDSLFPMRIGTGNWERMRQGPIHLYFEPDAEGIFAYHSINRFEDRKLQGGLAAKIDSEVWKAVTDILRSESESAVLLVNDEGKLLSLSGSAVTSVTNEIRDMLGELRLNDSKPFFKRTDDYFYFLKSVDDGEIALVKVIPAATIRASANATIRAGIATGSLFALASVLLSILVSLRISRPIVSLAKTMRQAHPNQLELTSVSTRDEIGLLERGYNSLVQRVKELIEHEYQREIDVKNAQLSALQAQINPHFLNNTLHMIGGMALAKNAPEIYDVSRVIGDLLRYAISTGDRLKTLEEELKHMHNYIFIQEKRFAGRCKVSVVSGQVDLAIRMPKFSLQPVLENAFEHGLQRKVGAWHIGIRIRRAGSRILVLVKDDGVGMPPDRLMHIREELRGEAGGREAYALPDDSARRKGIGLRNVDARMRLQFGSRHRVRIFSGEGLGTLVVLALPAVSEGEG